MTESSWTRLSRSIPTKIAAAPTKTKVPGRRFVRRLRLRPATLAVVSVSKGRLIVVRTAPDISREPPVETNDDTSTVVKASLLYILRSL